MKSKFNIATLVILTSITLTACGNKENSSGFKNPTDEISYALGVNMGETVKKTPIIKAAKVNNAQIIEGLSATLNDKKLKIEPTKAKEILIKYFMDEEKKISDSNLEKGKNFLAENAKKQGVVTTSSGLQYTVKKQGNGLKPSATDVVKVEYEGKLIDGKVFDSSLNRENKVVDFPLNNMIKGFKEGLQLMSVGSEYTLYIPADLAYGESSPSPEIPTNSALIFDIKLVDVIKNSK